MQELEMFKTSINLAEFASSFGYRKDRAKSSTNAPVMQNQNGSKIVIARDKTDGHYIYFNPHDNSDSGSIIDFIQNRTGENLGEIRKRLRMWIKNPTPTENIKVNKSNKNTQKIINIWEKIQNKKMKQDWRGIKKERLNVLIQHNRLKYDGNAIYTPLINLSGICGIEKREIDSGEKRIINGSEKGVWTLGNLKLAKKIVILESQVDLLSYEQLKNDLDNFYVATMGSVGESAENSLQAILEHNKHAKIVIATDRDAGGEKIAEKVEEIAERVERMTGIEREGEFDIPSCKDWNEELEKELNSNNKNDLHSLLNEMQALNNKRKEALDNLSKKGEKDELKEESEDKEQTYTTYTSSRRRLRS